MTPKRIKAIVQRHDRLIELAVEFVRGYDDGCQRGPNDVTVAEDGSISYRKNTSCHCHPEYEGFSISATEFNDWLVKQN